MNRPPADVARLQELEQRQEEVLRQLVELESRLDQVLREVARHLPGVAPLEPPAGPNLRVVIPPADAPAIPS